MDIIVYVHVLVILILSVHDYLSESKWLYMWDITSPVFHLKIICIGPQR